VQPSPAPEPPQLAYLFINSTPSGATVFVDGRLMGLTPVTLTNQAPGRREIELRADGYQARRTVIDLQAGNQRRVAYELEQLASVGQLYVRTDPSDARVTVADIAMSYRPGIELPSGQYRITVSATGYRTRNLSVDVGNSESRVYVALERKSSSAPTGTAERVAYVPTWAPPPQAPMPTCFAQNTIGQAFYWTAPSVYAAQNQAIAACQMNTPMGAFCQPTGCR
jgi:hypothetical protein